MQKLKAMWTGGCRSIATAVAAGAVFQISSCSVDGNGVINAFADPGALADFTAQVYEQSFLARVFDLDGSIDIHVGADD